MTKQEEIREWIANRHCNACLRDEQCSFKRIGNKCPEYYKSADEELQYLYSRGVVIKVDRELPKDFYVEWISTWEDSYLKEYFTDKEALDKAGYILVEPLIKEG